MRRDRFDFDLSVSPIGEYGCLVTVVGITALVVGGIIASVQLKFTKAITDPLPDMSAYKAPNEPVPNLATEQELKRQEQVKRAEVWAQMVRDGVVPFEAAYGND